MKNIRIYYNQAGGMNFYSSPDIPELMVSSLSLVEAKDDLNRSIESFLKKVGYTGGYRLEMVDEED